MREKEREREHREAEKAKKGREREMKGRRKYNLLAIIKIKSTRVTASSRQMNEN